MAMGVGWSLLSHSLLFGIVSNATKGLAPNGSELWLDSQEINFQSSSSWTPLHTLGLKNTVPRFNLLCFLIFCGRAVRRNKDRAFLNEGSAKVGAVLREFFFEGKAQFCSSDSEQMESTLLILSDSDMMMMGHHWCGVHPLFLHFYLHPLRFCQDGHCIIAMTLHHILFRD